MPYINIAVPLENFRTAAARYKNGTRGPGTL